MNEPTKRTLLLAPDNPWKQFSTLTAHYDPTFEALSSISDKINEALAIPLAQADQANIRIKEIRFAWIEDSAEHGVGHFLIVGMGQQEEQPKAPEAPVELSGLLDSNGQKIATSKLGFGETEEGK